MVVERGAGGWMGEKEEWWIRGKEDIKEQPTSRNLSATATRVL